MHVAICPQWNRTHMASGVNTPELLKRCWPQNRAGWLANFNPALVVG